jgi:hypothetical protein
MTALRRLLHRLLLLLSLLLPRSLRRRLLLRRFRPARARLAAALRSVATTQHRALLQIVGANRRTEFGRAHAFDQIADLAGFASRVPLRGYRELEPYLQRQRRGEANVLLADAPLGFALSGGSGGQPRAIPVSAPTLALWSWAEELLWATAIDSQPAVTRGRVLQLLPVADAGSSPALPLAVLAEQHGASRGPRTAVPWQLCLLPDAQLRLDLALQLAAGQPVMALRAACPGTLTILAEHLERRGGELVERIARGQPAKADALPDELRRAIALRPDRALAARLRGLLMRRGRLEPRDLWPSLRLLVCSTTGPDRAGAERLPDRFGSLPVLDPGYRAAEGVITLPWLDGEGGLPALDGQVLEFLPRGADTTVGVAELQLGQSLRPVLTSAAGLYRYLLDDLLEVARCTDEGPRLTVLGRAKHRVQLDGGTLSEEEVTEAVVAAVRGCQLTLGGFTAWATAGEQPPAMPAKERSWLWRLLGRRVSPAAAPATTLTMAVEAGQSLSTTQVQALAEAVDVELRASGPYAEGRAKGQLARITLLALRPGTFARRSRRRLTDGAADGHAPPPALADDEWGVDPEEVEAHA